MATSSMMLRALAVAGMLLTPLAGLPAAVDAAVVHEGDYDDDFAEDGRSRVSFASADNEEAHAVALAPGGKVVVAGWAYNAVGADEDMGIVRYRSDGVLDTSFNHGGIKSLSFGDGTDHAYAVVAQPDGKVVVAGSTLTDHFEMSVARLTVDGSLDRTFSGDGLRHIPLPDNGGEIFGMALQPDGRILLAGYAVVPYPAVYDFAVVRLLPNGALDRTFGGDGVVTTPIRSGSDMAQAIAIQPDGKLVVAGWSAVGVDLGAALARYRPDGRLDAGFGTGGLTVLDPGDTDETFNAIALLPGGKIGLAGTSRDSSGIPSGLLARVSSSGALDPGFGSPHTGWFLDPSLGSVNALLKQRDGHLVAVGDAGNKIVVGRFGPGGAPDPDFAGDGEEQVPFGAAGFDDAYAGALQRDGKIIVAGRTYVGTASTGGEDNDFATVRLVGDATRPTAQHMAALPRFSRSRTLHLGWSAADDNTGVRSFDVRSRSAVAGRTSYGAWSSVRKATAKRSATVTVKPGRTYCFAVRARDYAGNTSTWSSPRCTAVPLDDRSLVRHGAWTDGGGTRDYLRTTRTSVAAGAALTTKVAFRRLALLVTTCPGCGKVTVTLGSHRLATVDLTATRTTHRKVVVVATSATPRSGTLRLVQSRGGRPVTIDGVAVSLD